MRALTRDEYEAYWERHGHAPGWPPVKRHSSATAILAQKHRAGQDNQVPQRNSNGGQ